MKKNIDHKDDSIKNIDPYQMPIYVPLSSRSRKMIPDIEAYISAIEAQLGKNSKIRMFEKQNDVNQGSPSNLEGDRHLAQSKEPAPNQTSVVDKFSIYGGVANHLPNVYLNVFPLNKGDTNISSEENAIKIIASGMVKENSVSVEVKNNYSIQVRFELENGNNEINGHYSISDMEYSFRVNTPIKFIHHSVSASASGNTITLIFSEQKQFEQSRVIKVKYQ